MSTDIRSVPDPKLLVTVIKHDSTHPLNTTAINSN